MKVLLITDAPVQNPGFIATETTKKEYLELLKNSFEAKPSSSILRAFTPLSMRLFTNPLVTSGLQYFTQNKTQIVVIPSSNVISKDDNLISKITPKSHTLNKRTILDGGITFDDHHFCGIFKSKEQFKHILDNLPTDDSEFVICDAPEISKYAAHPIGFTGVAFVVDKQVIPASDFSDKMWSTVRLGVLGVFGNLNAKSIRLTDKTTSDVNAELRIRKEIINFGATAGLNFHRKCSYEISCDLNGTLDVETAKIELNKLDHVDDLKLLATQMIANPRHLNKIQQCISLDASFGIDVNLLSCLQGSFEGGYSRVFDLEIQF